jgi:predicted nucleotidyltransferase component of viral defense system
MIQQPFIQEWSKKVPWQNFRQVEQDLVITRALLEIHALPSLRHNLAFRGGTALNKLYISPPSRYSEDLDFVQIEAEPIGKTITDLRSALDHWLGEPKRTFSEGRVKLLYRFMSEDNIPLKLKVEINSREHFSVLGFKEVTFASDSSWHSGTTTIKTYALEEMLGTKMRALYQRRKGRDLFDLYVVLRQYPRMDIPSIITSFRKYMEFGSTPISKETFLENMEEKLKRPDFRQDILPLLPLNEQTYNIDHSFEIVRDKLILAM